MTNFKQNTCESCGQTTDYAMAIDKGTAYIVIAIFNAIGAKKVNRVHLLNEMACEQKDFPNMKSMALAGRMTLRMICNASRAVRHGLIAMLDEGSGEYVLTKKGMNFLCNQPVPRVAIIDKRTHSKLYYWNENEDQITIKDLFKKEVVWEGATQQYHDNMQTIESLFGIGSQMALI